MRGISFLFLVSLMICSFCSNTLGQQLAPDWWDREITLGRLRLPDDRNCRGDYIINALISSGIPLHVEHRAIVKGEDIVLGINPAFSETDKVWIEARRDKQWNPIASSIQVLSASEVVTYYLREAGDYKICFINGGVVILPGDRESLAEKIHCDSFEMNGITLRDVSERYMSTFQPYHNLGFVFARTGPATGYPDQIEFDLSFPGGSLKGLLCMISDQMNMVDDSHIYCWEIGGLEDQRGIGFKKISRERFERLFVSK